MENPANSPHAVALRTLGVSGAQLEALCTYLQLLSAWNSRVNLTGARTPEGQVAELVAPVVPVSAQPRPGRLVDVGAGNGSPGVVLAILRPDLEVTLLEPRVKRWAFLREVARACGCTIDVRRARHDGGDVAPAETVTLRALALPLGELAGLVRPGGQLLVFGGRPHAEPPFRETQRQALPKGELRVFVRD